MKRANNLYYILIGILIFYTLLFFIISPCLKLKFIDFFTGLGAIGTVSSLLFIYTQILKNEEQFTQNNKPLLFPLNRELVAYEKVLATGKKVIVEHNINEFNTLFYDNKIQIKCLKTDAIKINVSIFEGTIIRNSQEFLYAEHNKTISIGIPQELAFELTKVDSLEATMGEGDAYERFKNLKYSVKIDYSDLNNQVYRDVFSVELEASIRSFDIVRTVASINFKKV